MAVISVLVGASVSGPEVIKVSLMDTSRLPPLHEDSFFVGVADRLLADPGGAAYTRPLVGVPDRVAVELGASTPMARRRSDF